VDGLLWGGQARNRRREPVAAGETVGVFLVFSMARLGGGDLFKRKFVRIYGKTLSEEAIRFTVADDRNEIGNLQIPPLIFVGVAFCKNVLVGASRHVHRVPGIARALKRYFPSIWAVFRGAIVGTPRRTSGPAIHASGATLVAFMQFGEWGTTRSSSSGRDVLVAETLGGLGGSRKWLSAAADGMKHGDGTCPWGCCFSSAWDVGACGKFLLAIPLLP